MSSSSRSSASWAAETSSCTFCAASSSSGESWPIDHDFIAALRHGMPDAAGIALGVDRLVMLCAGAEKIEDVLWAPVTEARGRRLEARDSFF